MKKQIISLLLGLGIGCCTAQTNKLQVGYDASFHTWKIQEFKGETNQFASLYYANYTHSVTDKWAIQAEFQFAYGAFARGQNSSSIIQNGVVVFQTSTNQVGRPLSAYPELKAQKLGYAQFEVNDQHFTYSTFDVSALYNVSKNEKNELYIALGASHTMGSREYILGQVNGTFSTTNFNNPVLNDEREMFLIIPFYERFAAFGWNTKLIYDYNLNDRTAVGGRLTYHSFFQTSSSNYFSFGINFQVKF